MKRLIGVLPAIFVALAMPIAASAAGSVTNGSFETGSYVDGGAGFDTLSNGSTAIDGWTVTTGTVDWIGSYWQNEDGAHSLDLNGTGPGAVSQTLATVVNNTYVVQFYLAGNPDGGPSTKVIDVTTTGGPTLLLDFTNSASTTRTDMGWTVEAYTFVAKSSSTTLTFAGDPSNQTAYGPTLDNVSTTETAAQGANCKDGGWQGMVDSNGVPFKNQGACVSFYAVSGATPIGS